MTTRATSRRPLPCRLRRGCGSCSGTRATGVFAVGGTVTLVADSGAQVFRTDLGSPVQLLVAGTGPGQARVAAALADGRVVTLSRTGQVLATDRQEPGAVSALALALPGLVVQVGRTVTVGSGAVTLPPGGLMLDYRQGAVVYRKGSQVRAVRVASGADTLLQVIVLKTWQPLHFSTDSLGSAWARGTRSTGARARCHNGATKTSHVEPLGERP
jgi:hypothetical protein